MSASTTMRFDATIDDFVSGLVGGMAAESVRVVNIDNDRFYSAAIAAYEKFRDLCAAHGLRPRFILRRNRVYGDCPDLRDALQRASARELVSFDNPRFVEMRLKYSPDEAEQLLSTVAGGSALYLPVARCFKESYDG